MKKALFTPDREFMNVHTRGTVSIRNIAKTVFTAVGFLVLAIFLSSLLLLLFQLILPDGKIWRAAEEYLCFLPFWLVIPLYKASKKDVLFPRNGASETYFLKPLLFGTLIGSILFVLCLLFPLCSDNLQLIRNSQFVPAALLPLWAAVFIQAGGEELFFRVFFQRILKKNSLSPFSAILIQAFLYSAAHAFNEGFSVTALGMLLFSGILYGIVYERTSSFFSIAAIHTIWNFAQAFVFGLPNSGETAEISLFTAVSSSDSATLTFDSRFGLEGAVTTLAVHLVFAGSILFADRKRLFKKKDEQN